MRPRPLSLLTICILAVVLVASQPARAQAGAWCAHYAAGLGGINCRFADYVTCVTDLRGIGGWCERNMFYRGPLARPAKSRPGRALHRRRHRAPQ